MTKKINNEDNFESDNKISGDFDDVDIDEVLSTGNFDVRRRLERIREDKELERLINGNKFEGFL